MSAVCFWLMQQGYSGDVAGDYGHRRHAADRGTI